MPTEPLRPSDVLAAFFAAAIAFLVAAAVAGGLYWLGDWPEGRWLALHLAFVGGVSQLVLGASQFFVGAFLATTPPSVRLVRAQLAAWNAGALLVAVGVTADSTVATDVGTLLLLAGLVLLALGFREMERRSLQRATWAVRWYYACAVFLAAGVVIGAALARGVAWEHGNLLGAHLALNLAGWFGTAIVGTLHTFYPSLTQTRLRLPRLQGPTFIAWTGGTAALAAGHSFDVRAVGLAGWCALTAAAVLLAANMLLSARDAPVSLSLPARLVALGQLFLLAGLAVGLVKALGDGAAIPPVNDARPVLATLLLAGWLGLTVLGSLVHLLALLVRIGDLTRPFPEPRRLFERSVPVLAGVAVTALALARLVPIDELTAPAAGVLAAAYALLAARILMLASRALRQSPPRILAR